MGMRLTIDAIAVSYTRQMMGREQWRGKQLTWQTKDTTAHETTKGRSPSIVLFAQVHHGSGEEGVGSGTSG